MQHIELETSVDQELIGGFVLQVGINWWMQASRMT